MKAKFAKEKSEYAHIIMELLNEKNIAIVRLDYLKRIKELENKIKEQDDEIIFVVTTKKTNPFAEKCAAPMNEKDITLF